MTKGTGDIHGRIHDDDVAVTLVQHAYEDGASEVRRLLRQVRCMRQGEGASSPSMHATAAPPRGSHSPCMCERGAIRTTSCSHLAPGQAGGENDTNWRAGHCAWRALDSMCAHGTLDSAHSEWNSSSNSSMCSPCRQGTAVRSGAPVDRALALIARQARYGTLHTAPARVQHSPDSTLGSAFTHTFLPDASSASASSRCTGATFASDGNSVRDGKPNEEETHVARGRAKLSLVPEQQRRRMTKLQKSSSESQSCLARLPALASRIAAESDDGEGMPDKELTVSQMTPHRMDRPASPLGGLLRALYAADDADESESFHSEHEQQEGQQGWQWRTRDTVRPVAPAETSHVENNSTLPSCVERASSASSSSTPQTVTPGEGNRRSINGHVSASSRIIANRHPHELSDLSTTTTTTTTSRAHSPTLHGDASDGGYHTCNISTDKCSSNNNDNMAKYNIGDDNIYYNAKDNTMDVMVETITYVNEDDDSDGYMKDVPEANLSRVRSALSQRARLHVEAHRRELAECTFVPALAPGSRAMIEAAARRRTNATHQMTHVQKHERDQQNPQKLCRNVDGTNHTSYRNNPMVSKARDLYHTRGEAVHPDGDDDVPGNARYSRRANADLVVLQAELAAIRQRALSKDTRGTRATQRVPRIRGERAFSGAAAKTDVDTFLRHILHAHELTATSRCNVDADIPSAVPLPTSAAGFTSATQKAQQAGCAVVKTTYESPMSIAFRRERACARELSQHRTGESDAALAHDHACRGKENGFAGVRAESRDTQTASFRAFMQRQREHDVRRAQRVQRIANDLVPRFIPVTTKTSARLVERLIERSLHEHQAKKCRSNNNDNGSRSGIDENAKHYMDDNDRSSKSNIDAEDSSTKDGTAHLSREDEGDAVKDCSAIDGINYNGSHLTLGDTSNIVDKDSCHHAIHSDANYRSSNNFSDNSIDNANEVCVTRDSAMRLDLTHKAEGTPGHHTAEQHNDSAVPLSLALRRSRHVPLPPTLLKTHASPYVDPCTFRPQITALARELGRAGRSRSKCISKDTNTRNKGHVSCNHKKSHSTLHVSSASSSLSFGDTTEDGMSSANTTAMYSGSSTLANARTHVGDDSVYVADEATKNDSRYETLYLDHRRVARLRAEALERSRLTEMDGATFSPALNTSRNRDVVSSLHPSQLPLYSAKLSAMRAVEEKRKHDIQAAAAKAEQSMCTFAPQLSREPQYIARMAQSFGVARKLYAEM